MSIGLRRALIILAAWHAFLLAVELAEDAIYTALDYAHPVLSWIDEL